MTSRYGQRSNPNRDRAMSSPLSSRADE